MRSFNKSVMTSPLGHAEKVRAQTKLSHELSPTIQSLQYALNGIYAAAETLMSLRNPDRDRLTTTLCEIDQLCDDLISALVSDYPDNVELIQRLRSNKHEFDLHKNSRLKSLDSESHRSSRHSHNPDTFSIRSKHSSASCSSEKRRAAEAKHASAKLALDQLSEREQEDASCSN